MAQDRNALERAERAAPPSTQAYREAAPVPAAPRSRDTGPSLFLPTLIVGLGVVWLLAEMGFYKGADANALLRILPVFLLALGAETLVGKLSKGAGVTLGLLIVLLWCGIAGFDYVKPYLPEASSWMDADEVRHNRVSYPLGDVETAHILLNWPSAGGRLRAGDGGSNLLVANVDQTVLFRVSGSDERVRINLDHASGGLFDGGGGAWEVELSPEATFDLRVETGSGAQTLDLTDLQIEDLDLHVGSGAVRLTLPERSEFDARIDGGSGPLTIVVPEGLELRIRLDDGSGHFEPGERLQLVSGELNGDGTWETSGFDDARYRVTLRIEQGSGAVEVR